MRIRITLAALALAGLLAGCSSTSATDTGQGGAPSPGAGSIAASQQSTATPLADYSVSIAALGLDRAPLVPLGLNADHTIQVPPLSAPRELGVYDKGPLPGASGPAVILGHINSGGTDGAFAHLASLKVGDTIDTFAPGGAITHFTVYRAQAIDKAAFPTAAVYSDTKGPELRLISCGGQLDRSAHNYLGQVLVFARKA